MAEAGDDCPERAENDAVEVIIEDDEGLDAENDSNDDSGNSTNDEEEEQRKIAVIEERISQNPYVYEDHVQLISILSELADPYLLEKAYERLNSWCALEPDQWLHRLHVIKVITESDFQEAGRIQKAHNCFENAIREVYNYQVYIQWLDFAMNLEEQGQADLGGIFEPRRIFSKALDMAGSDPLHGHEFWEKALIYESRKLEQMDPQSADYEDQVHRVFDVYGGWLSKPLLENDNLLERFDEFVIQHDCISAEDIKEVRDDYQMAQVILQKILPLEEKLTVFGTTSKAVSLYIDYINTINELILLGEMDATILKSLLPMLYDRASYECCSLSINSSDEIILNLCETLLVDYAEYAKLRDSREYIDIVLDRIIKRWPKSYRFWIIKMHEQERRHDGLDAVKNTFELALASCVATPEDSVELWLAYLEAVKRLTNYTNDQQVQRLRSTFRLAWDSLGRSWGDRADPGCSILLYWARIEYQVIGDHKRGKALFEEVFECGTNKTLCNVWLELATMESYRMCAPPAHKISDLFKRALKFVSDWPQAVCNAWLNHERDHGTVDSLEDCKRHCKDAMDEWQKNLELRKKAKMKTERLESEQRSGSIEKFQPRFNKKILKSGYPQEESTHPGGAGRSKQVHYKAKKADQGPSNIGSERRQKILMPPPSAAPPAKRVKVNSGAAAIPRSDSEDTLNTDKNSRTVFISNLGYNVNEDNLKTMLGSFGEVEEVRIRSGVKAFGGSICYCVYRDQKSTEFALSKDRTPLDGRPMFISLYSEEKSSRRPKFQYSTEAEKNKLFVRNLPFEECTNERLSQVFKPHGKLKDIRIVTRKDGRPKGLAYIDYEDESSAATALKATNGMKLGNLEIIVALSAPPSKSVNRDTSLGNGRREQANENLGRGKSRTQLSPLIPRALLNPKAANSENGLAKTNISSSAQLTNSDFRTMLLGKK